MDIAEYVLPELAFLTPFLYLLGVYLKKAPWFRDDLIPLLLGGIGSVVACVYQCMARPITAFSIITGIVQGVLYAGLAVYANQIYKQAKESGKE